MSNKITEGGAADALRRAGLKAKVTGYIDDTADGEVSLVGTNVHVQVGKNYLIVCRSGGEGNDFWVQQVKTTTMRDLVADVRSVLLETV